MIPDALAECSARRGKRRARCQLMAHQRGECHGGCAWLPPKRVPQGVRPQTLFVIHTLRNIRAAYTTVSKVSDGPVRKTVVRTFIAYSIAAAIIYYAARG